MTTLKQFIKAVRAAKTIADERTVIQKESAAIRTSFRDKYSGNNTRRQNIAKLLYLFTLGERTHFGQVECVNLLATPDFPTSVWVILVQCFCLTKTKRF